MCGRARTASVAVNTKCSAIHGHSAVMRAAYFWSPVLISSSTAALNSSAYSGPPVVLP
jgi:hypothetical protein